MASQKEIIKRDGRVETFNKQKVINAVKKAFVAVDGTLTKAGVKKARRIGKEIETIILKSKETLGVEDIQDLVEELLMATDRKDVAKAYMLYRNDRNKVRNQKTNLMQAVAEKLFASNVQNQNANVDEMSFGGRMGEARAEVMKDYALNYIISPFARENHFNNEIYIHDLDSYAVGMHNCLTVPFDDLLAKGFNTRQTDVRAANSVNTAFQLIAVLFQLQSLQQFGGVSATHLDWTMVPYVRMSFRRHFANGLKYIQNLGQGCLDEIPEDTPIDSYLYWDGENRNGIYKPLNNLKVNIRLEKSKLYFAHSFFYIGRSEFTFISELFESISEFIR